MTPEHSCAMLQARNKKLKQALRRVLRAAEALEYEKRYGYSYADQDAAQRAYDDAVAKAKKVLKET